MMHRLGIMLFVEAKVDYLYSTTFSSLYFLHCQIILLSLSSMLLFADNPSECKLLLTEEKINRK